MAPLIDDLPDYRPERDPYAWALGAPLWVQWAFHVGMATYLVGVLLLIAFIIF